MAAVVPHLTVHEVTAERWPDFERLFEARGGPKSCWCMVWRPSAGQGGAARKAEMKRRIDEGTPIGLLGYLKGEPVAWCSVAPRASYRRLVSNGSPDDGIWSMACFFIVRPLRGMGLSEQLIAAAKKSARRHGAKALEAYPVDADSPSYRFMGQLPLFERAGFEAIGREGKRRHVVQLKLSNRKT